MTTVPNFDLDMRRKKESIGRSGYWKGRDAGRFRGASRPSSARFRSRRAARDAPATARE